MTTRPRVILIHNYLSPYRIPLFRELAGRFDLQVWLMGDVSRFRKWNVDRAHLGFDAKPLPHLRLPIGDSDYRPLVNYTISRELRQTRADVIIGCGWDQVATLFAPFWSRRAGIPYILWSGSTSGEASWRRSATLPLVRTVVRASTAYLAYGTRAEAYLVDLGASRARVFRAYNAVETEDFALASEDAAAVTALRKRLGLENRRILFFCGQLIDRKGLPELIEAFSRVVGEISDLQLVIAGDGEKRQAYQKRVQDLRISHLVTFLGFVGRESLPHYYAVADLFALPSREEVWGLVLNEALACGTPVLTTAATGASADIVRDGWNGYVVEPGSADALERAIRGHFGLTAGNRGALREHARTGIAEFSISGMAVAFESAVALALGR